MRPGSVLPNGCGEVYDQFGKEIEPARLQSPRNLTWPMAREEATRGRCDFFGGRTASVPFKMDVKEGEEGGEQGFQ